MAVPWQWRGREALAQSVAEQEARYQAIRRGEDAMGILLCEHEPVITLGRYGKAEHIVASPETLTRAGVEVMRTDRGGDVTYHGPGQLMLYPVVRVRSLRGFIGAVGEAIAAAMRAEGIDAVWKCEPAGVWVGDHKLAACGLYLRHGIVNHGFAVNICHDPAPWQWIIACGAGAPVTSVAAQTGAAAEVALWAERLGDPLAAAIEPWVSYGARITSP